MDFTHSCFFLEKSKVEDERRIEELQMKLEEALALRQETEAKLQQTEKKLSELESRVGSAASPGKVLAMIDRIVL